MRTYPCNSPQAAARLVALTVLADGYVGRDELVMLEQAGLPERLGLRPGEFHAVLQALCEDLMAASHMNWGHLCRPDADVVRQLAAELADPLMRAEVLSLCRIAAQADQHLSEGEFAVLNTCAHAWRLSVGWDVIGRQQPRQTIDQPQQASPEPKRPAYQ